MEGRRDRLQGRTTSTTSSLVSRVYLGLATPTTAVVTAVDSTAEDSITDVSVTIASISSATVGSRELATAMTDEEFGVTQTAIIMEGVETCRVHPGSPATPGHIKLVTIILESNKNKDCSI